MECHLAFMFMYFLAQLGLKEGRKPFSECLPKALSFLCSRVCLVLQLRQQQPNLVSCHTLAFQCCISVPRTPSSGWAAAPLPPGPPLLRGLPVPTLPGLVQVLQPVQTQANLAMRLSCQLSVTTELESLCPSKQKSALNVDSPSPHNQSII